MHPHASRERLCSAFGIIVLKLGLMRIIALHWNVFGRIRGRKVASVEAPRGLSLFKLQKFKERQLPRHLHSLLAIGDGLTTCLLPYNF